MNTNSDQRVFPGEDEYIGGTKALLSPLYSNLSLLTDLLTGIIPQSLVILSVLAQYKLTYCALFVPYYGKKQQLKGMNKTVQTRKWKQRKHKKHKTEGILEKKKIRKSKSNCRGKFDQQNTRDERKISDTEDIYILLNTIRNFLQK